MAETSGETPSIVTTKKEKDPKRVEAGKRLAAISKQAKERKKKERERPPSRDPTHGSPSDRRSQARSPSHHHQVDSC